MAESTEHIVTLDGRQCRVWRAWTEGGQEFAMFVRHVAVPADADFAEFERDLLGMPAPTVAVPLHRISRN